MIAPKMFDMQRICLQLFRLCDPPEPARSDVCYERHMGEARAARKRHSSGAEAARERGT